MPFPIREEIKMFFFQDGCHEVGLLVIVTSTLLVGKEVKYYKGHQRYIPWGHVH